MSYKPTHNVPLEIVGKIHVITSPLKVILQNIIKNFNFKPQLKQTASFNYQCVERLHHIA
jgi:hypothetical protein